MSFVTKRERVFNEYDLFDLPARNEGKLKTYASCTDARAWSHFCSDKSEHLVDLIKRNNETVRPKYLPTNVIVDTLMVAKNAEITRLKRKIEEFEQMMIAYDQLELSCDQKSEIAQAHAAIKAANKELDEMFLDLDISGYTEGIDSEGFETGKSGGDEETKQSKGVQNEAPCTCDVATLAEDSRIGAMQDTIITKDAKLNAMKNTIAVMETDVCEPYYIYAHIYTALAKIFGILRQNEKYGQYLKLLTAGKDVRCIDVKGKILYKLKVLEKFSCALIAPCTQDFFAYPSQPPEDCACYRFDIADTHVVQSTYALTSTESKQANRDNKRANLVADIIQNDEMKEIINKEKSDLKVLSEDNIYNIDKETQNRLKRLQENYDDLLKCYENLKHENDDLEKRCNSYEEMEEECKTLKLQMHEYNSLWNEKEHFRKRSADLDSLKEQYLILSDETSSLETQLKAEGEINHIKSKTMDDLQSENISLEKSINNASIAFEKEKNSLTCKLKEADCRIMCQEQQIKSLLEQIDKLLEQGNVYSKDPKNHPPLALLDELESSKEQIQNLKDALITSEEEKGEIQKHYQHHLELINELKLEIEDLKSMYEKTLQRNDYLEKYNDNLLEEASRSQDNLINVIKHKSIEIDKLVQDVEKERDENKNLYKQLNELRDSFDNSLIGLENEKLEAIQSLQLARQESQELLDKVKDYDQVIHKKADLTKSLEQQLQDNKELQALVTATIEENRKLKNDLDSRENNNSILLQEVQRLRDVNESAAKSITSLEDQKMQYAKSLDLTQKESGQLVMDYENLKLQLQKLKDSKENVLKENMRLENELLEKSYELENAMHSIQLNKRKSEEMIDTLQQSEGSKDKELSKLHEDYQKLSSEKHTAQKALVENKINMDNLLLTLNNVKLENEKLLQKCDQVDSLQQELEGLQKAFTELSNERNILEANKTEEYNHLYNTLEKKIEENRELLEQIKSLKTKQATATNAMHTLQSEKMMTQSKLDVIKKESAELLDKIKYYEALETEYEKLKRGHDQMASEKKNLENELNRQLADLRKMEQENSELHSHSQNLLTYSEDLETALTGARTELIKKSSSTSESLKDIMDEIELMRQEKLQNQQKISDLRDQLDKAEHIMVRFGDDILARDDHIATLQNHINELEEEVSKLQESLGEVISTSEEMKDFSIKKIDTIQNIEAHHSRATHNMKMEIAKLQNENFMLSEQLSVTKIRSDESARNKYQYASQIKQLQYEREIIVTDIKQLELESIGDTALSPNNCSIEEILASLDRIRNSFKVKTAKSSSLERTLLKVQTSSQLLLSKADEAKKIVEREKQKIITEKEDAIKDKQHMETDLFNLKATLEKQIFNDKIVIEDLEATISNQKLIIDRINKSTQDYIAKLEDELETLKNLYRNSVESVDKLQEKLDIMTVDKSTQLVMMEEVKADLEKKSNEVMELQKQLEALKNKPHLNVAAQANITNNYRNIESQTDNAELFIESNKTHAESRATINSNKEKKIDSTDMLEKTKIPLDRRQTQTRMKQENRFGSEVHVLSAAVEQPFDVNISNYADNKKIEQNSIACSTDNENSENKATMSSSSRKPQMAGQISSNGNELSVDYLLTIDLLLNANNQSENNNIVDIVSQSQEKSTEYAAARESSESDSNIISKHKDMKEISGGSSTGKSTDKDLFVIYKDSDSNFKNKQELSKEKSSRKGHSDMIVEAVTVHPIKNGISAGMSRPKKYIQLNKEKIEEDRPKQKLIIKPPKVLTESLSIVTTSDVDVVYSSPKPFSESENKFNDGIDDKTITISALSDQFIRSYDEDAMTPRIKKTKAFETESASSKQKHSQIRRKKATISTPYSDESHHKLSRVGADVLLLKAEQDQKAPQIDMTQNFGLEYIIDTVQGEIDPVAEKYYAAQELRKTRSDERFNFMKIREKEDSSPSRLSDYKTSNTDYKTTSSNSKSTDKSSTKYYTERSVMAKLESNADYELQINTLTKALENIEKDYKKKIEAIKMQYDNNIKSIINEHNQGVKSIQSLHEETLQDIVKLHESEVENLRTMSMEAMRKADKLEKENRALRAKAQDPGTSCLDEEPVKMTSLEVNKRRKCRGETRMLTTTTVEAINVAKARLTGPCTCSMDVNISDTIRNIFEQVDVEQRKMAEHTYLKYIASKIMNGNIEGPEKHDALQSLDAQELSFLHLKVCRSWKTKLTKEEALQKRIDSLETELMNKQRNAQQHIVELDRKVAEERRRLQEVLETVCRRSPPTNTTSRNTSPTADIRLAALPARRPEKDACGCQAHSSMEPSGRTSAGDLAPSHELRATVRRPRPDSHRATLARLDGDGRRERRPAYNDEPPTRLRRSHDRQSHRLAKK